MGYISSPGCSHAGNHSYCPPSSIPLAFHQSCFSAGSGRDAKSCSTRVHRYPWIRSLPHRNSPLGYWNARSHRRPTLLPLGEEHLARAYPGGHWCHLMLLRCCLCCCCRLRYRLRLHRRWNYRGVGGDYKTKLMTQRTRCWMWSAHGHGRCSNSNWS